MDKYLETREAYFPSKELRDNFKNGLAPEVLILQEDNNKDMFRITYWQPRSILDDMYLC